MSKSGKYIRYAIGELLIVVLGIGIAVKLNDMKHQSDRRGEESALLLGLRQDLESTHGDLRNDLAAFELSQLSYYKISDMLENDGAYYPELPFDLGWLSFDEYVYPSKTSYIRARNLGMDIIQNPDLRRTLVKLYEEQFPRIARSGGFYPDISDYFDEYYTTHFRPNDDYELTYEFELPDVTISYPQEKKVGDRNVKYTFGYVPVDFNAWKADHTFRTLMHKSRRYRDYKLNLYRRSNESVERLLDLIDQELERR